MEFAMNKPSLETNENNDVQIASTSKPNAYV